MNRPVATCEDLAGVAMACTHCGMEMTPHHKAGSKVRYFQCPSCLRWVSSTYSDVLKGDAKFAAVPAERSARSEGDFKSIKERLERWLAALDTTDPFRVLGVSPNDSGQQIKRRYRELALSNHPDRGGSVERMRLLNLAYERVVAHQQSQLEAGQARRQLSKGGGEPRDAVLSQ